MEKSLIETIDNKRDSLLNFDSADTKSFISNEYFYENICDKINWNKNNTATKGDCSKLFIRTMIELAYRKAALDTIDDMCELFINYKEGQKTTSKESPNDITMKPEDDTKCKKLR